MHTATVSNASIVLMLNGEVFTLSRSAPQAERLINELRKPEPDEALLQQLATLKGALLEYSDSECSIDTEGNVFRNGEKLHPVLAKRVLDCYRDRVPYQFLLNFFDRLQKNPSHRAVNELYTFLEHMAMPITPEGFFLGYKSIRTDWTDWHTGKYSNRLGNVLSMQRKDVDDDTNVGCSVGFHVGSLEYARTFGYGDKRIVLVAVDPADVVSIPQDCGFQKLRTCRYKVVAEYVDKLNDSAVTDATKPYDSACHAAPEEDFLPDVVVVIVPKTPEAPSASPPMSRAYKAGRDRALKLKKQSQVPKYSSYFTPRSLRYLRETYGAEADEYQRGFRSAL